jgi:hypothetical protein
VPGSGTGMAIAKVRLFTVGQYKEPLSLLSVTDTKGELETNPK